MPGEPTGRAPAIFHVYSIDKKRKEKGEMDE
jgi:hypothetical protein